MGFINSTSFGKELRTHVVLKYHGYNPILITANRIFKSKSQVRDNIKTYANKMLSKAFVVDEQYRAGINYVK
jgi:hypothetical protein